MIPVLIVLGAWWAVSGVVAHVKRVLAPEPATAQAAAAAAAPNPSRAKRQHRINPDDVTFGQWQQAMYKRWKTNVRKHLPGQHLGRKAADLIGDITAATIAGAAIFGAGFATGTAWAGTRWSVRHVRKKTQRPAGAAGQRPNGPSGTRPTGPRPQFSNNPAGHNDTDDVIDAELLDDTENPTSTPSPYADAEDAVLIGQPQLLARYPTAPNGDTVSEILNIHQLLDYARTVIDAAIDSAEQATIRANSASERADQAGNRSITAGNRAASAELVVANATAEAAHLEQTAARFGSLNMDSASLTSITASIESANTVAETERRRVEAEANVAACAAALAAAEEQAAAVAAESARVTLAHVEAVKNMYDTVQARQMPHAEAQAATGNAAAHESLLAAN